MSTRISVRPFRGKFGAGAFIVIRGEFLDYFGTVAVAHAVDFIDALDAGGIELLLEVSRRGQEFGENDDLVLFENGILVEQLHERGELVIVGRVSRCISSRKSTTVSRSL